MTTTQDGFGALTQEEMRRPNDVDRRLYRRREGYHHWEVGAHFNVI